MPKLPTARVAAPETVWLARGRHTGPDPQELLRENLRQLKADGTIDDFMEPERSALSDERAFEARWHVDGTSTVRARLTVEPPERPERSEDWRWTLAAEADHPWNPDWSSPATRFWPDTDDATWDHDVVPGLRLRDTNPLPKEDAALRRLLKDAARHSWSINVVVHEAMTPDPRGRLPLTRLLPPVLRHRVVEHRAAPEQFQAVNWALGDLGTSVPRGGAVILPGTPLRPGYDDEAFTVRSVFLDGSEPTELLEKIVRYAELPWPLPDGAAEALAALRQDWHLVTIEEELAHARALLDSYAEALDAMTKSRDLYREATELAHAALADLKDAKGAASSTGKAPNGRAPHPLAKTLQRVAGSMWSRRATGDATPAADAPDPKTTAREPDRPA
ncbi:hypothetical protein [Streptomyces sp. Tue6028]|uniref:hypothetical protein n=1 Tax=Streptomyces sp. Tue6028 TaxID=2036037 RepID=UPI003EC07D48